jgi:ADP-ribosylglycohydrolase
LLNKYKGCLFGLAVGDALGAAVEFMSSSEIKIKYGEAGIPDFQGTTVRYITCDIARILIG